MSLPIMLNLIEKKVLVVGGGTIGTRKALSLFKAKAKVTCISPDFSKALEDHEGIRLLNRKIELSDLDEFYLVVSATDDDQVNAFVYEACKNKNILCQTVDAVNDSDFDFMACRSFEDLIIGVSTYGQAPAYAKKLIKTLAEHITDEELVALQKEITNREVALNKKC